MAKHKSPHPVGPYQKVSAIYPPDTYQFPPINCQFTNTHNVHIMPHRYMELPNIKWIISVMFLSTANRTRWYRQRLTGRRRQWEYTSRIVCLRHSTYTPTWRRVTPGRWGWWWCSLTCKSLLWWRRHCLSWFPLLYFLVFVVSCFFFPFSFLPRFRWNQQQSGYCST